MRARLEAEGLPQRAEDVAELAERIESARHRLLADELPETYRTERMHHVTTADANLTDLLPSVDAVIISGFTRFDALEREFLNRVTNEWPVVALLPLQADAETTAGVDRGARRALETYLDLGFQCEYHYRSNAEGAEGRGRLARSLYRHPEQSPATEDIDVAALNVAYSELETVPEEIRTVAREIRVRLGSGVDPDDIGVVLADPVTYTRQVQEIFDQYTFPFNVRTEAPLTETALGELVETVCQLSREPRSIDTLLDLLTNPLVSVTHDDEPLEHTVLARTAARVETKRLDSTLSHIDDAIEDTIDSLIQDASALAETSLTSLPDQLTELLEKLGVQDALERKQEVPTPFIARESNAHDHLNRVLETLALTEPLADQGLGNSVDRLERALSGVTVRVANRSTEESVAVCALDEALYQDFEHVYVLGMTSSHFPSDPERIAFTRPIYECHPDFEQTDVAAEARYHFGALLGSDAAIHLSAPQRSISGEPYVKADVLTELQRLIDLTEITTETDGTAPGCQEDVQRGLAATLSNGSVDRARGLLPQAIEVGVFDAAQRARIESGIKCASARTKPELTAYDGQLSPEVVSRVHTTDRREPYSPSRLESYAACGFKYYMRRVLGIKAPEPLAREPDAGIRGSYVHDVLEHYYRSLQSDDGEPVHPAGNFESRQEQLLSIALDRLDETFDGDSPTAFQEEWLIRVLAGLGTADENQYYGPNRETADGRPFARGLLYRFLEHEFDEPGKTTARPTWFEARVGDPYDAGTSVSEDPTVVEAPSGPVPIHGLIDRVETVPGTNPRQVIVRDYKTGSSIPSERDALLGLNFQLPLYSLMAEDALDDVETVGASYYQVSPPTSVSSRSGLLTSQEMAVYHGSDDVETPLLRHSYPHFETHDAFRRFVEETTPERLGHLATGITEGMFHPTVLDPSDAGCRYCDYAEVCDVRSHRRQETIAELDRIDHSAYIPPVARELNPEDVVEVQ